MILPLLICAGAILVLLIVVSALRFPHTDLSRYELERRKKSGNVEAAEILRREENLLSIEAVKQPFVGMLLVVLSFVFVLALGWLWGSVASIVVALWYRRIASVRLVRTRLSKLYSSQETRLLTMAAKRSRQLRLLTGRVMPESRNEALGSKEELLHRISESAHILSSEQKKLVGGAVTFSERTVVEVMTERAEIVSIEHSELLGPLVLSDLHGMGHSCFPVTAGDLDHIVGMLDIRRLLTLEAKRSVTAAKAMLPEAYYVRDDQTLTAALAAFVRTRHHLLVVINKDGITLGLVSLRDVLEALFGRPMNDEFAGDDDLRMVAKRHL